MSVKILFCGLGSIGRRHANLLQENFDCELFAYRTNKGQENENLIKIKEFNSWDHVDKLEFDVAFITNPTSLHIDFATKCANKGMHLFIEKPVDSTVDGLDNLLSVIETKKLTTYVAYPLRFHPVIKELKKMLKTKKVLHSRIFCTSYLPNWQKGKDHLKSYSASKEMGGGVLLDLSHEIDYASYLFGDIKSIYGRYGKKSNVTIDSEDFTDLIVKHSSLTSNIHLNYFSQNAQRKIEIETEDSYIRGDLIKNSILVVTENESFDKCFEINMDEIYLAQLKYYFDNISNNRMANNMFEASKTFRKIMEFKNRI